MTARAAWRAAGGEPPRPGPHPWVRSRPARGVIGGARPARIGPGEHHRNGTHPTSLDPMPTIDPTERGRRLAELAAQQAVVREAHVTKLAGCHDRLRAARAELAAAETAYRGAWRQAITAGLLTGAQLRSLGLPAPDARRRPPPRDEPAPSAPFTASVDQPADAD